MSTVFLLMILNGNDRHASLVGYALTSIPSELFIGAPLNYATDTVEIATDNDVEIEAQATLATDADEGITWFHDLATTSPDPIVLRELQYINDPNTMCCKISDKEHICTIYIGYGKGHLGKVLPIFLDFSQSLQPCHQVKMSLILVEKRHDDVLVQEKEILIVRKATQYAHELFAELRIPYDIPTTFDSLLVKVSFIVVHLRCLCCFS